MDLPSVIFFGVLFGAIVLSMSTVDRHEPNNASVAADSDEGYPKPPTLSVRDTATNRWYQRLGA